MLAGGGAGRAQAAQQPAKTAKGLVEHCKAQLGMFYWYGTFGQVATLDLLKEKQKQYPSQFSSQRYEYARNNHINKNKRVYDCTGLIESYWMQPSPAAKPVYSKAHDKSADGFYCLCVQRGRISGLPETAGILVFVENAKTPGKMDHVGVYLGGGQVIEARGFYYGVVKTSLSSRPWSHWGRLPESWLSYESGDALGPGARVRVSLDAATYYPGLNMPKWVRGKVFTVEKILDKNGNPIYRGGKRCVLLKEIQTWCDIGKLQAA